MHDLSSTVRGGFSHTALDFSPSTRPYLGQPEARQVCTLFLHRTKQTGCPELTMINHPGPFPRALAVPGEPVSERWAAYLPKSTSACHKPTWTHKPGCGKEPCHYDPLPGCPGWTSLGNCPLVHWGCIDASVFKSSFLAEDLA